MRRARRHGSEAAGTHSAFAISILRQRPDIHQRESHVWIRCSSCIVRQCFASLAVTCTSPSSSHATFSTTMSGASMSIQMVSLRWYHLTRTPTGTCVFTSPEPGLGNILRTQA